ncbi:MAG TPA: phosphoglycolate phosphatase [Steroidobacteraceae bacterium]|nr:phosphoglycolate phosphatase [Steroidobacteraceae bacterium]HRX89640.1 phosphoglycolate phosphatase [Steroidobacteraceae bacterium]
MSEPTLPIDAVLFDLDGTLLDTAPDMGAALNALLQEEGQRALPAAVIRPHVSHGAKALVTLGFGVRDGDAGSEFERRRLRFLALYSDCLRSATAPFEGIEVVLAALESSGRPWGIVTNKPGWLTEPLLASLGLDRRAACVVSGDTLAERKPHPRPLLHAADVIGITPARCLYVGDAERDMQAAAAAGMRAVVARYGYLGPGDDFAAWPQYGAIDRPCDLLAYL